MIKIAPTGLQGVSGGGRKSCRPRLSGEQITESVPKNCACGRPADLVLLRVFHLGSRKIRIGAAGDFIEFARRNNRARKRGNPVLRYGFLFRGWRPYCWQCRDAVAASGRSLLEDV